MRIFVSTSCCLLLVLFSLAQPVSRLLPDTIRLSEIQLSLPIADQSRIYIDSANKIESSHLHQLPALNQIPASLRRKVDARFVGKEVYLQFSIWNDLPEPKQLYILPGFYFREINLFKLNRSANRYDPQPLHASLKKEQKAIVRQLDLQPGEIASYITELKYIKTTVNCLSPILTYDFYLPQILNQFQNERKLNAIITYLICGVMLMMIFYSLAGFYINRSIDFIYYAVYALLVGTMFFFKAFLYKVPIEANFFFESYFDFVLQATGTLFYFIFLRNFIRAPTDFPVLNAVLFSQQVVSIGGLILFTFLNFFTDQFDLQNMVENLVKYAWSFSTVFFIAYALINRTPILRYLAIGHIFLFVGGLLSLFLINTAHRFNGPLTAVGNDSLFWYEMGVLFELVFFLVALSNKNKQDISSRAREKERLLMDHEKEAYERKMEILAAKQDERNRISADMHDELGSGVTAIRLMSELAKAKMKDQTLPEIEKISHSANDLISKMNTIIWTMQSSNDSLDNMIAYVRSYASEFLDNTDIRCSVESPAIIPVIELSGEKRRNIFLCIKEALNNIAKHAKASAVVIRFKLGAQLVIQIHDNGIGLDAEKMRAFSNGLTNMRKRMETIDGHFAIRNDQGTVVTISIPIS